MADFNEIVKVAVDAYKGCVEHYSLGQANELVTKALVEMNGGSTKLNYKNIRDGKCNGLFAFVEEVLSRTVVEGLQGDEYFNALVDFRNLALGDSPVFVIEDNDLYVVAEIAEGVQTVRRQRLGGSSESTIPTTLKVVKIYEELNRVLAGRVDFNKFIQKVAESFRKQLLDDIYALWSNVTAEQLGGTTYFPVAGAYDEEELLELISHVEAAAGGKKATIVGTKKALRNLKYTVASETAKEDIYNLGYVGKFFSNPVVEAPQRHKLGSTEFVMDDNCLTIIAGDEKPIKVRFWTTQINSLLAQKCA